MKIVVQRALGARVEVENQITGQIERGLVAFVGVSGEDDEKIAEKAAQKLANLRIFSDENGKFNHNVREIGGAVLLVSNFTLCGDAHKGNRPNFMAAALPEKAERLYDSLGENLQKLGIPVQTGSFGADMKVWVENEGPVTIILEW